MTSSESTSGRKSIEQKYERKLRTRPLVPKNLDLRYPRHGVVRWFRVGLRFWLLPVQIGILAVVASLVAWVIWSFIPSVWPILQTSASRDLNAVSATGQVLLLAPLALLISHYPAAILALFLFVGFLWHLDSWAAADRRREYITIHKKGAKSGTLDVPLRLIGDAPFKEDAAQIEHSKFDPLEFHKFVDVITQLIVNSAESSPLVVSLEAKWGMGKTTAMHMIQRRLRDRIVTLDGHTWKCFTVYFNAWKYDEGQDVRKGLMSAVFEEIPPRAIRWHLRESRGQLLGFLLNAASLLLPSGDATTQLIQRMDHQARYRNEFEHDMRRLLDHWAGMERKSPLLVVFVDDLDRCLPPDASRTLETIKLFFDIPGCIFVLGFDPARVAAYIHEQHPDTDGAEYLKKLVQLNYRLPKPSKDALANFTGQSIEKVGLKDFFTVDMFDKLPGGATDFIRRGTGSNPREIMRFLNATAVSTEVVHSQLKSDTDRIALSLLMMLQVRWPAFYEHVIERLSAKLAEIERISPPEVDHRRATALQEVLSDAYRDLGLQPIGTRSDSATHDEISEDDGGRPPA